MTTDLPQPDVFESLMDKPVVFGLTAQGHLPTIEAMLGQGASWQMIGKAIGWCPITAERHYGLLQARTMVGKITPPAGEASGLAPSSGC